MKHRLKLHVLKKQFAKRIIINTIIMCLFMITSAIGINKVMSDYKTQIKNINGVNNVNILAATDIGTTNEAAQTDTPTQTVTPTTAVTPTVTPTITPTVTPTVTPSVTPTVTPTAAPLVTPTVTPSVTDPKDTETPVNVSLDYIAETLTITRGVKNSTVFYISQDKQKTWEVVEDAQGRLDLSIFMKTSDNYIYVKGDKDKKVVEVKIPKEDNSLKVSYIVEAGTGKLKFTNALGSLEYRKGPNSAWKVYYGVIDLTDFEINGYTLQFRTMTSVTTRAGKIATVKISKRQTAPTIKTDYSKFVLSGMKYSITQYRLSGSNTWITFEPSDKKIKTLDLSALLLPKGASPNSSPIPAGMIEFRNLGTENKVASGIRVIETLAQPVAPDAGKVKLEANKVFFTDASRERPYEYLVLHTKEAVNLSTAKWKKVTSSNAIEIKKVGTSNTVAGDVIYYRIASVKDGKTKEITPASMFASMIITSVAVSGN